MIRSPQTWMTILVACCLTSACAPDEPDLRGIHDREAIRLLHWRFENFDSLPRKGLGPESYRRVAEGFASELGVAPQWRMVDRFDELIPRLLDGEGDVVVANLMVSEARAAHVAFTVPLFQVSEWVLARKGAVRISNPADFSGLTFGSVLRSAARETTRSLAGVDESRMLDLPAGTRPEGLMAQLAGGAFDAIVLDDGTAAALLETYDGIERVYTLPQKRNVAWAVRPDSPGLLATLNDYITQHHLAGERRQVDPQDWAGIRERGRLRMLTVDGPVSYYLWRGELMGFDYELMKRFARAHKLQLEVVLARSADDLVPWLLAGRGDVVAASVTITPERERQGIRFSRPYLEVDEVLLSRRSAPEIADVSQLAGRTVTVNPLSVYGETLAAIAREHAIEIDIETSDAPTEELIERLIEGQVELTVADSHVAAVEAQYRSDLRVGPTLKQGAGVGWAVKAEHTELLDALNDFIRREYRRDAYGALHAKYFRNERRMSEWREHRLDDGRLSPYDDIVRPIAARHKFDWRLIVAQIYEESEFDPMVRSRSGARGLMQIVPTTAVELGVDPADLVDPTIAVDAGVRYMAWVRSRFPDTLPLADRQWFTLAAYNAGPGHVQDARILARRQGWDGNQWFGSVERAMLLLSKREYARKARHGYVRGIEPVNYVASIRRRYQAYIDHNVARDGAISR